MIPKGRPPLQKPACQHQQRSKKSEPVKQYWTEHRLTLIAYEAQYIKAKQPIEQRQEKPEQNQPKKKGSRKKVNLQYQSAFLSVAPEESEDIKVEQLVKSYDSLAWLFCSPQDQTFMSVREFVKIMLELKHSAIVKQFCQIYNIIVRQLKNIQFDQVEKEDQRFQVLQGVKSIVLAFIDNKKQKFPYFVAYLHDDAIETKKLILVQAYCLLAEKFNFNINQFYSQAFAVNFDKPSKKVKKDK